MKKLILFIITSFSLFLLNSCFKANDNVGHDGRCTGSEYCTACSNCSRCGHCSGGGTCGVCRGSSSSGNSTNKAKTKKNTTSDFHKSSKNKSNKPSKVVIDKININLNSNNRYIAGIATTFIYEKPSKKSNIIEKVSKDAKLIQLSKEGDWYKVQVKSSSKKGYVYYKDVK